MTIKVHRRQESVSATLHDDQLVQIVAVRMYRGVDVGGVLWMSIDAVPWLVWGRAPCQRYNSAYRALSAANGSISPEEAIWSAVYDMSTGEVQVVMDKECDQIHAFQLEMKDATVSRAGALGEEPGAS